MNAKEYSWKWVTADELLSHGACELISVALTPNGTAADATLYDGENTEGKTIIKITTAANPTKSICFKVPIYCRRGLYYAEGSNVTGCFIQWRELGH